MLLTQRNNDIVYGVIYKMDAREKPLLDLCEGAGYRCETLDVHFEGRDYQCFVYIAEQSHIDNTLLPHQWYKEIVLLGAQYHQLPEDYLKNIRSVASAEDPEADRREKNQLLINEMRTYQKSS